MTKLKKISAILLSVLLVVSALPFYAAAGSDGELTQDNVGEITAESYYTELDITFEDFFSFSFLGGKLSDSNGTVVSSSMFSYGNTVCIDVFDIAPGTYTLLLYNVETDGYGGSYTADTFELICTVNSNGTVEISFAVKKPEITVAVDDFTVLITVSNYNFVLDTRNTVYTLTTEGNQPQEVTGEINENQISFDLSSFSQQFGEAIITVNELIFIGKSDYITDSLSAVFYINPNNTFTADYYVPFTQSGTQDDPYIINEDTLPLLSDFCSSIENDVNKTHYFRLVCDLDNVTQPISLSLNNAVFDGDGHKVTLNYNTDAAMSLFGVVGRTGVLKNLVIDGRVEANLGASVLANINHGLIYNCTNLADLTVRPDYYSAASMVGGNYGKIINCDNHGAMTASVSIGGINSTCQLNIGSSGSVENCFAACEIGGDAMVGGIVCTEYRFPNTANGVIKHSFYDSDLMGNNIIGVDEGHIDVFDSTGLSTYECKNGLVDELNSYVATSDIEDLAEWVIGTDGYPTLYLVTKYPVENHTFSSDWSYDKDAHWHECTDEECSIEDYAVCELSGAAYGEHIDSDGDGICDVCNVGWITSTNTVLKSGKWIVDSNVFCFDTLTVDGDIEIYLEDMCTLNALGGIVVPANCKLTVNAESANSDCGSLIAMGKPGASGIGGTADDEETVEIEGGCGTIIINGGKINAVGGSGAAGIGGGYASESGSVTVNDAVLLQAMGYVAIGEGENAPDLCRITINTDLAVEAGENQYDITALTYTDEAYVRITNIHGTDYICGIADVSCGFEGDVEITITDVSDGSIVYEGSTDGSNVYYIDGAVADGTYLLEASSYDAVTRTYTVTVGTEKELADVELYTEGDVNGDGEIDEYDYQQSVNIALSGDNILSKTGDLSDDSDYSLAVADIDCDGVVDVLDVAILERKINA